MFSLIIRAELMLVLFVVVLSFLSCVRWRVIYRDLFVTPEPVIPSALDDWDEEFARITGSAPLPTAPTVTLNQWYGVNATSVSAQNVVFTDCRIIA